MATKISGSAQRLKQVAYVEIGFYGYLMDADKAMQLMKALSESVKCEERYNGTKPVYYVSDTPNLRMTIVNPNAVRQCGDSGLIALESNRS